MAEKGGGRGGEPRFFMPGLRFVQGSLAFLIWLLLLKVAVGLPGCGLYR